MVVTTVVDYKVHWAASVCRFEIGLLLNDDLIVLQNGAGTGFLYLSLDKQVVSVTLFIMKSGFQIWDLLLQLLLYLLILQGLFKEEVSFLWKFGLIMIDLLQEVMKYLSVKRSKGSQIIELEILRIPLWDFLIVLAFLKVIENNRFNLLVITITRGRSILWIEFLNIPIPSLVEDFYQLCIEFN
jgi:hypothetical protein